MLSNHILHLFLLLSLIISSCSSESGRPLTHADSVMEQYPDSAMSILMDIDRKSLKEPDLPYYALLYTQAQVKTDVPLDSDSLISIAYAKYGNDTRGDRGIRSNFYTGEVYFNRKAYREAMRYYLTAYEESKRLRNDYWRAKAAERISNIFFIIYNYDEAANYAQEAADYYKIAGRIRNHRFSLGELASILLNNGYYDRAYAILDSLNTLCSKETMVDSVFLDYIKLPLIDALVKTGNLDQLELTDSVFLCDNMTEGEMLDAVILKSEVYSMYGRADEMIASLRNHKILAKSNEDIIHILYAQYENAKASADNQLALTFVDSMLYYQNEVVEDILQESVLGAQRDFYSEMAVRHETRSHFLKWLLMLIVIIFVLVVFVVVIFFIFRNKVHKAELQAQLEEFLSLKAQADQNFREKMSLQRMLRDIENKNESMSDKINELQNVKDQIETNHNTIVEKLFKERWTTLDALCDQYYGLNNSELNAKDLVSNMEKELKKIVSKKGLIYIVEAVNTYMGGIITDLKAQCPFLKEADINFLALLFAGFSVRSVCMFIGIKYDYFYVKKSRLIKRIETSEAPDKALFLQKLK